MNTMWQTKRPLATIGGEDNMNTLIAYATKYGCTEKCAAILSEKLTGKVDLCNLKERKAIDLSQYDKVVIGGSIYAGKVRKEVSEFCSENHNLLKNKKLGLFICGMLEDQAETELNNSFSQELLTNAVAKNFFGGEFQFKKMKFMEKFIVKMVSKADKNRPVIDTGKDISTVSEQTISRFANTMNNV